MIEDTFSMSRIQKVLFLGIMIIPFTSLRFSFLGVGEILVLLCALFVFYSDGWRVGLLRPIRPFVIFWLLFFLFSTLGFLYNVFFLGFSSGRQYTFLFDGFSYLFVFLTVLLLGDSYLYYRFSPYCFFRSIFLGWGIVFSSLFAVSFVFPSIFGLPLRYHDYFSPFVDNVHQAASLTCVMPFVMLHIFKEENGLSKKILTLFMALAFVFMAVGSGSTKALMGVVVGGSVTAASLIFYRPGKSHGPAFKMVILFSLLVFLVLFVVSNFSWIDAHIESFFHENDGGGARAILYRSGIDHAVDSFFVGYGPGSHAPYGVFYSDAHNTLLTIALQSGALGLVSFLIFVITLMYRASDNFFLSGALASALMYIIGGDILRRLPIWIMLIGIAYLAFYSRRERNVLE